MALTTFLPLRLLADLVPMSVAFNFQASANFKIMQKEKSLIIVYVFKCPDNVYRSYGPMVKASDYESGDSRFDPW
jgi:hypothetical protein